MFKKLRIFILLIILIIVAGDSYLTHFRAVSWDETLWVGIYPINPAGDSKIDAYIDTLSDQQFDDIEEFFKEEADGFGLNLAQPLEVVLTHPVRDVPPPPPENRSVLNVMWWSLNLRYWVFTHDKADFTPDIKIFVVYHPFQKNTELEHSLGIEKGMIGVVHGFAHRELEGKNNMVIAHELLHTLGATDKYSFETGQPVYPEGYAEPDAEPRFPQHFAELMGGKIPVRADSSVMPRSLRQVVIGNLTAQEINWLQP